MEATKQQIAAAFAVLTAVADTIRELGSVPSGDLYAQLMGRMDIHTYNKLIDRLKGAGLVSEDRSNLLTWTGPVFDKVAR